MTRTLLLAFLFAVGCGGGKSSGDGATPKDLSMGQRDLSMASQDLFMGRDMRPSDDLVSPCGGVNTAQDCGACGNACPGLGLSTDDVTCVAPATKTCGLTCRGENYDVNSDPTDGCEKLHAGSNHTAATATSSGSHDCDDASIAILTGVLLSDARTHTNPPVDAFDAAVGSAPDYFIVYATGGVCENNYALTFTTSGGGATPCYTATIETNLGSQTTTTISGSGSASISAGSGSYGSDSNILFVVQKTCSLPVQEAVTYSLTYHL